jgi:hypothetical protein
MAALLAVIVIYLFPCKLQGNNYKCACALAFFYYCKFYNNVCFELYIKHDVPCLHYLWQWVCLIDDAIVVIENIYRHMDQGETPMEAAKSASDEIGLAVMATTFTIVAVFVPVAFMPGIVGRFFLSVWYNNICRCTGFIIRCIYS